MTAGSRDLSMARADTPDQRVWAMFWVGLLLTTIPLLIPYFKDLWDNVTYRFFPFAILATAWLGYDRWDRVVRPPRGWFSWALLGGSALLVIASILFSFTWFAAVAAVLIVCVMFYSQRGELDATLLASALPLLPCVQLIRFDKLLVQSLQHTTTWMSSVLLDLFGIPHAVSNNVLQLADRELFVAEACSGIQSVFTLSFLSLLVVAWKRRRAWMVPVYLLVAVLLAVFANVIRVTTVALAAAFLDMDFSVGWPHDLLGYFALVVCFAFLMSFDYLLAIFFHGIPESVDSNPAMIAWNFFANHDEVEQGAGDNARRSTEVQQLSEGAISARFATSLGRNRVAMGCFFGVMLLLFLGSGYRLLSSSKPRSVVFSSEQVIFDPRTNLLDSALETLSVVDHKSSREFQNSRLGANSDIWNCQWGDLKVQFVVSQPYKGWHELCDCYERIDWKLLDRSIRSPRDKENQLAYDLEEATFVAAQFRSGPVQRGYLFFSGIGSDGVPVDAPNSMHALAHRIWNRVDSSGVWNQNELVVLQMWVTSAVKLTPEQLRELESEFLSVRGQVAAEIQRATTEGAQANAGSRHPNLSVGQARRQSSRVQGAM